MPERDLGAQLRSYFDATAPPVTVAEISARSEGAEPAPVRRIGLALLLTAAVVAAAVVLVTRRDEVTATGVAGLASTTAPPTSTVAPPAVTDSIDVGGDPQGIVVQDGSVWVAVSGSATGEVPSRLVQLDPDRLAVVGSTELFGTPIDLAAGGGSFWVAGNAGVMRVDPLVALCQPLSPGGLFYTGVVYAFGSVWAVGGAPPSVVRIDPATSEVVARIENVQGGFGIAAGAGSIWVAGATDREHPVVTRIDPATNEVVAEIPVPSMTRRLLATDDAVYATVFVESPGGQEGGVYEIDPVTNQYVRRIGSGAWVGITAVGDQPWVVSYGGTSVGRLSAGGSIERVDIGAAQFTSSGDAIAFGAGAVWAASRQGFHLVRIGPV
jgi:hypothetical protein